MLIIVAWLIGGARIKGSLKTVAIGIGLQFAIALLLLHVAPIREALGWVNNLVTALASATEAGTSLVFGYLGGGPSPFDVTDVGAVFILGFRALPMILLVSALTSLLTYWRILPWIIHGISRLLERCFGIGGAVGLATAANIFVGPVEAPLFIRPYLERLTRSELFLLMVGGSATIAGTMFVIYASILGPHVPDAAGQLLVASVMSAPAAITMALLMVPETQTQSTGSYMPPAGADGTMDAIVKGTEHGLKILFAVIALLVVVVALVNLVDQLLGLAPDIAGTPLSLQRILGVVLAPLAWLLGLPWDEAVTGGALLGTKVIVTEFVSYLDMAAMPEGTLSERSQVIMTYALSGFSSLSALGILIGGLSAMAPDRRADIVALGPRAILGGLLATCTTGCIVGVLS